MSAGFFFDIVRRVEDSHEPAARVVEDGEALQMALGPQAIDTSTPIRLIRGGDLREIEIVPAARPN